MADQNPLEGAMGGWWRWSSVGLPAGGPICVCRAETAVGNALIAEFRIVPGDSTFSGVWVSIAYAIRLRYATPGGIVQLVADTPLPDAALGHVTTDVARINWTMAWRFALVFRCSTWDADTSTYASDGFVKLFLNGATTPLLSATGVTIPRRPNGGQVRYTVAALADADRIWARSVASVPTTTSEGAFVTGTPSQLLYSEEFTGGVYDAAWTAVDLSGTGGFTPTPHTWIDGGGDGGWGMSIYACGPHDAVGAPGVVNHSYAGLTRLATPPPTTDGPPDGPPDDGGGGSSLDPPSVAPSYALDERIIRRLRRAPHLNQENVRVFYRKIELDLERGVGLASGQGEDPLVMLRLSRDGGHTWSEPMTMSAGRMGVYTQRVIARRLGQARDTVFEVTVSDPVAWSLVQAWLDLEAGTS